MAWEPGIKTPFSKSKLSGSAGSLLLSIRTASPRRATSIVAKSTASSSRGPAISRVLASADFAAGRVALQPGARYEVDAARARHWNDTVTALLERVHDVPAEPSRRACYRDSARRLHCFSPLVAELISLR